MNALAGMFPRGGWNFEIPNVQNFLAPVVQGMKDYRAIEQQTLENDRQNKLMQFQQANQKLARDRFEFEQQKQFGEDARQALMNPYEIEAKRAAIDAQRAAAETQRAHAGYYRAGAANLSAKAQPAPQAPAGPDPLANVGLDREGNIVPINEQPQAGYNFNPSDAVPAQSMMQGQRQPNFGGMMRLGGPMDDIARSQRLDEGRPQGVQVAQAPIGGGDPRYGLGAGGGSPPLFDQARMRAGMTSPEVPGVVTDAGRNRRVDVPATREAQGQRAMDGTPAEKQQRLQQFRTEQQLWTGVYNRPPRAGYYYGSDGREMPLTDKNFKGDREQQAIALMNYNKVENATNKLLEYDTISRGVMGQLNIGEVARAYADLEQGATGLAYALSGKTLAVAEMKSFVNAYKPTPFDSNDTIKAKVESMKTFYETLLSASRGGESYEQAFARAIAKAGLKNPDGGRVGAPAAAGSTQPQPNPVQDRLKNKYGLE